MFSQGHNHGIVEGIPIDRTRRNIVDILPYFKAYLVGPPPVDAPSRRENIDNIPPRMLYRYAFDDNIIMCVKTVLCIELNKKDNFPHTSVCYLCIVPWGSAIS